MEELGCQEESEVDMKPAHELYLDWVAKGMLSDVLMPLLLRAVKRAFDGWEQSESEGREALMMLMALVARYPRRQVAITQRELEELPNWHMLGRYHRHSGVQEYKLIPPKEVPD